MASFNLGRIKGDKGDKGDTGAKGETGAKGDKGDTGERGADGRTPVFSVGETSSISSSEEAYVELDTNDPENPVLSFYIPRGRDGKDAQGDMLAAVYDSEGVKQDFYKYAKSLSDGCIKISGGALSGALKAAEVSLGEGSVRNISFASSLPESAANGDICIVSQEENSKKLGECIAGDTLLLTENSNTVPYIVVATDYHKEDSVTLIRKRLPENMVCFDKSERGEYPMSDIDVFLEGMYVSMFSQQVRNALLPVILENNICRHCFLLSKTELNEISYLSTVTNRIAYTEETEEKEEYLVRNVDSSNKAQIVNTTGYTTVVSQSVRQYYRPVIVLPAGLKVQNTEYNGLRAIKLPDAEAGIYVYRNGEWKECYSV